MAIKKDRSIKEETLLSIRRRTIKMKNNNTKLVSIRSIFYTKIYTYAGKKQYNVNYNYYILNNEKSF
jgi:hypothetical protein